MKKKSAILLAMISTLSIMSGCAEDPVHNVHSYTEKWIEPTVTEQGYMLHTCTCGYSYKDNFTGISGTDHSLERPEYKILMIGNSMTYFNELWNIFNDIAIGEGYSVIVDQITVGGYNLYQFLNGDSLEKRVDDSLAAGKDIVIMQSGTLGAITNLVRFYDSVREMNEKVEAAGAKSLLYATAPRKTGSKDLELHNLTTQTMGQKVLAAYEAIGSELNIPVSPVAAAIVDVFINHPEIELWNPDKLHPSWQGSYLAALCHYAVIYGKSPIGVSYSGFLSDEQTLILQQAAHKAVFGGSTVTEEYKTKSEGVTQKNP